MMDDPSIVRASLPDGWAPDKGMVVTVSSDGTFRTDQAWTEEVIRVKAYGKSMPMVRKLLTLIDAQMPSRFFQIRGQQIKPSGGILVTFSEKRGYFVGSVTYYVYWNKEQENINI